MSDDNMSQEDEARTPLADEFNEFVMKALYALKKENLEKDKQLCQLRAKIVLLEERRMEEQFERSIRDYEEAKLLRGLAELRSPKVYEDEFIVRLANGKLCIHEKSLPASEDQ